MTQFSGMKKIIVCDPRMDIRGSLKDAFKELGIPDVEVFSTIKEIWRSLETDEAPDWIITNFEEKDLPNAFHLLRVLVTEPKFLRTRVSFILNEDQRQFLPIAYEMGLLSHHMTPFTKASIIREMEKLMKDAEGTYEDHAFVAANFLRDYLTEEEQHDELIRLEETMIAGYPSKPDLFLRLAEALIVAEREKEAAQTLWQAKHMGADLQTGVKQLQDMIDEHITEEHGGESQSMEKLYGIKKCLVVDSDMQSLSQLEALLQSMGGNPVSFLDGKEAFEWIEKNGEPDLIIHEWKLPGYPGAAFLQRVRQLGVTNCPIIVASSVVDKSDKLLLREMGVLAQLEKPYTDEIIVANIMAALREYKYASSYNEVVRKLRLALGANKVDEVEQHFNTFKALKGVPDHVKHAVNAEMAFAKEDYKNAKKFATEAFRQGGEDVMILNLLGKTYLKLGDNASALKCLNRATQMSAGNLERLCSVAEVNSEMGNKEDAEAAIEKAQGIDESNDLVKDSAAKVAINNGDDKKAKSILESVESLSSVVAYMNNRAVSMVRDSKVEEAIELYDDAVKSLPDKFAKEKASVNYNRGLAYARAGKLKEAAGALGEIAEEVNPALFAKVKSLLGRIEKAIAEGKKLEISPVSPAPAAEELEAAAGDAKAKLRPTAVHATPGELCLHMLFFIDDKQFPKEVAKALEKEPRFKVAGATPAAS